MLTQFGGIMNADFTKRLERLGVRLEHLPKDHVLQAVIPYDLVARYIPEEFKTGRLQPFFKLTIKSITLTVANIMMEIAEASELISSHLLRPVDDGIELRLILRHEDAHLLDNIPA